MPTNDAYEVGKLRVTAVQQLHLAHQFSMTMTPLTPNPSTQSEYRMRFRTALFLIVTGVPAVVAAAEQTLLSSDRPAATAGSQNTDAIAMGGRSAKVVCEGTYPHHLQGVCTDGASIYWSFTTTLVKTTIEGRVLAKVPVANHHGDLCHHDGRLYVAVNLGKFNDSAGNADSWVYVYEAKSLQQVARHEVQQVFHGAGGIGYCDNRFTVVGGLPADVKENYVYDYDEDFAFLGRRTIASGHTLMGIQTAAFAAGRWWFGCYGSPPVMLVTDEQFQLQGRYEADCSLGITGLPSGRLLVAGGRCEAAVGCSGWVVAAIPDDNAGFKLPRTPAESP